MCWKWTTERPAWVMFSGGLDRMSGELYEKSFLTMSSAWVASGASMFASPLASSNGLVISVAMTVHMAYHAVVMNTIPFIFLPGSESCCWALAHRSKRASQVVG